MQMMHFGSWHTRCCLISKHATLRSSAPPISAVAEITAAAIKPARQQSATPAEFLLDLSGRDIAVLWDLDNLVPPALAVNLVPAINALKVLLSNWGGTVISVNLYANRVTHARLGAKLLRQLADTDVNLIFVETRNQAADIQLTTDAYNFAAAQGQQGCVVIASDDTGFGSILSYISSLGLRTITLSTFPSPKYLPNTLPDLSKHPVAQHCHAAISWRPVARQPGATTAQKQQQQQQSSTHVADNTTTGVNRKPLGLDHSWFMLSPHDESLLPPDAADWPSVAACSASNTSGMSNFFESIWVNSDRIHVG